MHDLAKLKETLKKRLAKLESYRCHGADAYRVAHFLSGWNREHKGTRWIESVEGAGLRRVGYADELVRSIRHNGWYADSSEGATGSLYRGIVVQLPARNGATQFLAGYESADSDGVLLDMSRGVFEGDAEGDDAKHEAALAADSFAEHNAEEARDYDSAWQAGSRYAQTLEEIESTRDKIRSLIHEAQHARQADLFEASTPNICEAIRNTIASKLRSMYKLREERDELRENVWHKYYAAFNDGAGSQVLA